MVARFHFVGHSTYTGKLLMFFFENKLSQVQKRSKNNAILIESIYKDLVRPNCLENAKKKINTQFIIFWLS